MKHFGSVRLRAFQIGQALQQHITIDILPLSQCYHLKNVLLIVVKPRNYSAIRKLFGKGNKVAIDLLDTINLLDQAPTFLQRITGISVINTLKEVDAAIFCSDKTRNEYQHLFKTPELCQTIYHHWDNRFTRPKTQELDQVQIGYFGLPRKAYLADRVLDTIDIHDLRSYEHMNMDVFSNYNAHYIVKPDEKYYQYEPLTKIATAAFVRSPVIARCGHEQELLTSDYPYFIEGMREIDIIACIEKMRSTYRESTWRDAVAIMEAVYHETSLSQLSLHYLDFIKKIRG